MAAVVVVVMNELGNMPWVNGEFYILFALVIYFQVLCMCSGVCCRLKLPPGLLIRSGEVAVVPEVVSRGTRDRLLSCKPTTGPSCYFVN